MDNEPSTDSLLPAEMAKKAESVGVRKTEAPFWTLLTLAVLAGAFIALGGVFSTTIAAGLSGAVPYGIQRLLIGLVFSLGLILVIVSGAELFTGNNLIVMAWASRRVTTIRLLRNWGIVYVGNFIGALGTAITLYFTRQYTFGGGAVGRAALAIASSKVALGFGQAVALGIICNALVCLAVWMTLGARGTGDKIAAILFPVTAFVAGGFEHCIANMYFVPIGLLIKWGDPAFVTASGINLEGLTWQSLLLKNLLPVTIGNLIGGGVLVAAVYWFVYLREPRSS